jgi:hypothetical protein
MKLWRWIRGLFFNTMQIEKPIVGASLGFLSAKNGKELSAKMLRQNIIDKKIHDYKLHVEIPGRWCAFYVKEWENEIVGMD